MQNVAGTNTNFDASAIFDASVFNTVNAQDMQNIDYEQLLNSSDITSLNDGVTDQTQRSINSVLKSFIGLDEVQNAANLNGDGEVDETELQEFIESIMGEDGDASNLSMDDLNAIIEKLGIDLDSLAETAMDEAFEEIQDSIDELTDGKLDELEDVQNTQAPVNTSNSSPVGGGNYPNNSYTPSQKTEDKKSTAETIKEIEAEIEEKNSDIDDLEANAAEQIQEQEEAKEKAMKNYGVSDEEYAAYREEEQKLESQIGEKEDAISAEDEKITSYNATISSNESYITSLGDQIAANEAAVATLDKDSEAYSSKKADLDDKNEKLAKEKKDKEDENDALQKKIDSAEKIKKGLQTQKEQLEVDKQNLLKETLDGSQGFCKNIQSTDAVNGIRAQIENYDKNITNIRNEKDEKVAEVRGQIQELETKLQNVKAQEERDSVLSDNKVTISNLPEDLFNKDGILAGKEDKVAEIAEKYGLEPEFLASIMCLETGYGTSSLCNNCNNPGGTTGSGSAGSYTTSDGRTFAKYNSIEEGIEAMAKNLAGYTKYDGVTSVDIDHVDAIGAKYCVGGDWANKVKTIYNKIKSS